MVWDTQFNALRLEREAADQLAAEGRTSSGSTAVTPEPGPEAAAQPKPAAEKKPVVAKDPKPAATTEPKREPRKEPAKEPVKAPPTPAEKAATMRLLGYIGAGAGIAVIAYGGYQYADAFGRKTDLEDSLAGKNASTLAQKDEAKRIEDDLLSGGAILTTGLLVAAAGAAIVVLHPDPGKPKVSLRLTSPRSAALEVRF